MSKVFTSQEFENKYKWLNTIPNQYHSESGTWCTLHNGKWWMDCVVSIKGLLWGFVGDTNKTHGGGVYLSNGVADFGANEGINYCDNASQDFSNLVPGEYLCMKGTKYSHAGVYLGNGKVFECTTGWGAKNTEYCIIKDRDAEFFQKIIEESEPIYNGITGPQKLQLERERCGDPELRAAVNSSREVDSALDIFHLEAEPTERLMKFCEEQHISLTVLLLMGLHTYFHKMNGNDDVSINTAIARRATLKEKKSGGTRIHSFPFRVILAKEKTFLEGIQEIRDKQNEYFRHANYNPTDYFAYRGKTYPHTPGQTYESMSLTYQPLSMRKNDLAKAGGIQYKTKWYPNGATTQAMYLTVMHRTDDNGLDFNFEHQVASVTKTELEYMYYYLCKIMFKGIENPSLSIADIMNLV